VSVLSPGRVVEPTVQIQEYMPRADWTLQPSLLPKGEVENLCDKVQAKLGQGCMLVAVTSEPGRREAKSRVAVQIATGVAGARGPRVLLLEGDLARPRMHRVLDVEMAPSQGFTQQIQARIQFGGSGQWSVLACSRTLHVLGEGRVRSPELLASTAFVDALAELRQRYDLIVIDGPATDTPADLRALRREADLVVFAVSGEVELPGAIAEGSRLFGSKVLAVAASA
jgi:Mrp family chromosome partitioning ATPase